MEGVMAETTVTTNGRSGKDYNEKKLMQAEVAALRLQVQFLELLAAERKIKAKRMAVQAGHYKKLYKMEQFKEVQRKAQREKARQESGKTGTSITINNTVVCDGEFINK
jgi:hypothetical protein